MAKTCIFCGGEGPFSKEHVLPEWAAELLKVKRVRVTPTKLSQPQKPWMSVGSFGSKVGRVCEQACNNGWMSDLEDLAKPVLSKMILPKAPVSLSVDEQVIVAAWLWKLAIVHEYLTGAIYFDEEERTCLQRGDGPTLFGVHMWIAGYRGRLDANLKGGPCTFSAPDGRTVDGFLMSMSIRRFAAQLLCVRPMAGVQIDTVTHYNFKGAETLIWPERDHRVEWPPKAGLLDQALFDKWHTRWNHRDMA